MSGRMNVVDRIMLAVLDEPTPTPTRACWTAIRHGRLGDAFATVSVAWHLATVRQPAVRAGVRARSLALVVAVSLCLGSISVAAAAIAEQAIVGPGSGRTLPAVEGPTLQDSGQPRIDAEESDAPARTERPSSKPTLAAPDDEADGAAGNGEDGDDDDRGPAVTDDDSSNDDDEGEGDDDRAEESSSRETDGPDAVEDDDSPASPDADDDASEEDD